MIIDSHVHFWNYDRVRDSWITEDMNVIRRDFLPEDIAHILARNEVSGCIAVQADQSETETQFLLNLTDKNNFIKGVVGWADLKNQEIERQLEDYSGIKKLKGFRHISEGETEGFLVQRAFINGVKALHQYGFTYDILIKQHQLSEAIDLVDKVPGQPFVLDHCGKPDIKGNNILGWAENIKVIAQNPDVYCKLSGLLTQCHWQNWGEKEIFNCLDIIFDNFSERRVLFGSDWPVMLLSGSYTQWLDLIKKYTSDFPEKHKENIFGGNASRFYNL